MNVAHEGETSHFAIDAGGIVAWQLAVRRQAGWQASVKMPASIK
jgi:hypothetical protein